LFNLCSFASSQVTELLKTKYTNLQLPSPKLLRALVFQEPVLRTKEVMQFIRTSMFTNVLHEEELSQNEGASILLEASPWMLCVAAASGGASASAAKPLMGIIDKHLLCQQSDKEGTALERIVDEWLKVRVAVAIDANPGGTVTLRELLQLDGLTWRVQQCQLRTSLRATVVLPNSFDDVVLDVPSGGLADSHMDEKAFFEGLSAVTVNAEYPLAFIKLHSDEACDGALLLLLADGPFLVCYDTKANVGSGSRDCLPKHGRQSEHFQNLKSRVPADAKGASAALRDDRFCYLYVTTQDGTSFGTAKAIMLCQGHTRKLLGPMYEVYESVRNAFQN
jgi:hypothetical protein